jgi:hypothetical protein
LPVVDPQGVLQGVVTQDDVIEVMEEETTEDALHFGAIEAGPISDKPYWSQRIRDVFRARFVWLLLLFAAETLTGSVLRLYSKELEAVLTLSFFIPLIIGTGGNAGSQTVTTVIRALALKQIARREAMRVLATGNGNRAASGFGARRRRFLRVQLWGPARKSLSSSRSHPCRMPVGQRRRIAGAHHRRAGRIDPTVISARCWPLWSTPPACSSTSRSPACSMTHLGQA